MPLTFRTITLMAPGGRAGRPLDGERPFDGHELGDAIKAISQSAAELTVFGMMLGSGKEIVHFMRATRSVTSAAMSQAAVEARRRRDAQRPRLTLTNAMRCRRLAKSAFDLKIPLWLSSPVRELIVATGAVRARWSSTKEHHPRQRQTRRGARLRRLPHDVARRQKMFPHAPTGKEHYSPGPVGNTADGLRLAESAGGRIEIACRMQRPGCRSSVTTRKDGSKGVMPLSSTAQARRDRR